MPTPTDTELSQRERHLQITLDACLTWQERWASNLRTPGLSLTAPRKKLARGTDAVAQQKLEFLWDVLECCVTDFAGDPPRALHDLLRDAACYKHARALASLFRAAMFSRILKWKKFSYPVNNRAAQDAIIGRPAPARPHALWRILRRRHTAATELAGRLRTLADAFATATREVSLPPDPKPATVTSLVSANMARTYWGTRDDISKALDRFWYRDAQCDYSKHCLNYADYYYLRVDDCPSADARDAAAKVQLLTDTERDTKKAESCPNTKEQWRRVARNWLCRCFRKYMYVWDGLTTIRDSRQKINARQEVDVVVTHIDNPNATMYQRVRDEGCFDDTVVRSARVAVRMATAGATPREILRTVEDWEGGLDSLQAFFFVAATAKEAPKLQECWFDPSDYA